MSKNEQQCWCCHNYHSTSFSHTHLSPSLFFTQQCYIEIECSPHSQPSLPPSMHVPTSLADTSVTSPCWRLHRRNAVHAFVANGYRYNPSLIDCRCCFLPPHCLPVDAFVACGGEADKSGCVARDTLIRSSCEIEGCECQPVGPRRLCNKSSVWDLASPLSSSGAKVALWQEPHLVPPGRQHGHTPSSTQRHPAQKGYECFLSRIRHCSDRFVSEFTSPCASNIFHMSSVIPLDCQRNRPS